MELSNQFLHWPVHSNIFKEITFSFFNGQLALPIWAWIPYQPSTLGRSMFLTTQSHMKAIFDSEFDRFYSQQSYFPLKFMPRQKTIYQQQTESLCISTFFQLKIPQLQCQFLLYNNMEDGIYENIDLFQLAERLEKDNQNPKAIDLANILFRIQDQEILFAISLVINVQNAFSSALQNIQKVSQTWLQNVARWIFFTMFIDNSEKLRHIMDSRVQELVNASIQCQQVGYELDIFTDFTGYESIGAMHNSEQYTSRIASKKQKISNKTLLGLFGDVVQIHEESVSDISDIDKNTFSLESSSLQNACEEDFRESFVKDHMYVYKFDDQEYYTPLVIWDCLDKLSPVYCVSDALIYNLKTVSCHCRYLKRIANEIDGLLKIEYLPQSFTADEAEFAVANIFERCFLQQIITAFLFSYFKLTIIGPPPVTNLLARSLSVLAPPGIRNRILYAPLFPEYVKACQSTINDMQKFLDLPITAQQKTRANSLTQFQNNREVKLNSPVASNSIYNSAVSSLPCSHAEPNIYAQYEPCSCGLYYHGPVLAGGIKIYCISCNSQFFHYLDYLQRNDSHPVIVQLSNGQVLNFGQPRVFSRRADELLLLMYRGNQAKLRNRLVYYCAKLELDYCISIGSRKVLCHLYNQIDLIFCQAMLVIDSLVSELLQKEHTLCSSQSWYNSTSFSRLIDYIPPLQVNEYLSRALVIIGGRKQQGEVDNRLYQVFAALNRKHTVFRLFSQYYQPISTDFVRYIGDIDVKLLTAAQKQTLKGLYNKMINSGWFASDGEEMVLYCVIYYFVGAFAEVLDM